MKGAQISLEQPGVATSPDVQEADKHVAGATVSVDGPTVQQDLIYGSELSDDNTDSDSSTHSE